MSSFDLWDDLEREISTTLFVRTGLINFGKCNMWSMEYGVWSMECEDNYLLNHMGVLEKAKKPFEWLTPQEVKRLANTAFEPTLGMLEISSLTHA